MLSARCLLPIPSDRSGEMLGEADAALYVVSNSNRWSRATLSFEGVEADTWCEFSFYLEWHPQESNRAVHDFALVGVDFLTEDGSSIDFAYVPGLTRTQIDPHSWHVSGPDFCNHDGSGYRVSLGFFVPSPTRKLSVGIRSWRNSHPFTIRDPKLLQKAASPSENEAASQEADWAKVASSLRPLNARRTWLALKAEPSWMRFALLAGRRLLIRGQIINENPGLQGALARIVYRDALGSELPLPYPETEEAPTIGAFIDIPVHRQARRFTLDLIPPPGAASVDVGFQTWSDKGGMDLVTPLEMSLDDDLTLEAISGDDTPDAGAFLKQLIACLDLPLPAKSDSNSILAELVDPEALLAPLSVHDKLRAVQRGGSSELSENGLALANFPAWPLPNKPRWTEDPFQSPAWRLEFQSLGWLFGLVREGKADDLSRAVDLAVSWSRANPWGAPADLISSHPHALSARTEVFLRLLSLSARSDKSFETPEFLTLLAEAIRHAFALAQILGQNVFSHSAVHLHAACALFALARCLPRLPLAPHWNSIALAHLDAGFDRFFDEDGTFIEQSLDIQLEAGSLGLILGHQIDALPEAQALCDRLNERLRKNLRTLVAVTAPSGSLPPFGDAPYQYHHASWLRRLLSGYGAKLLSDHELAAELSYPPGKRLFTSQQAGLVAARHYERNPQWAYFCTSLNGRHHDNGHHDCTSFVYANGGAPWIIDPKGSSLQETGAARQYLVSSRAHNISLPNGRGQLGGIGWLEAHEELAGASIFVVGSNVHGTDYIHHRIFITLDSLDAIGVLDHFVSQSKPTTFEGFLHFDTDILVAIASTQTGVAYRKREKLMIIPYTVNGHFSGMNVENGRNDRASKMQGFVARPSGGLQPANVLSYRISGHEIVCGGVLLAVNNKAAGELSGLLEAASAKAVLNRLSSAR